MSVDETRMSRWMCDKTLLDRIRNENLLEMGEVVPIEDRMQEKRLRGYVYYRSLDAVVRRSDMGRVEGSIKGRGSPKLTSQAVVQKDLGFVGYHRTICPTQSSMEGMASCSWLQLLGS